MPTILELFQNKELLFPGGNTAQGAVKKDSETFIEQETSGIRIKSKVDLNNPLIYGNESSRIVNRSTPVLEDMIQNTMGTEATGGLIGKGLDKLTGGKVKSIRGLRDKINSTIGFPETQIPSRLIGDITQLPSSEQLPANANGSELGKFLKQTGGGNPKTIGKQVLGKGLELAKDKLRGALFGEQAGLGSNDAKKQTSVRLFNDETKYSDIEKSKTLRSDKSVKEDLETEGRIRLNTVSPIYGIQRKGDERNRYLDSGNIIKDSPYSPEDLETTRFNNGKITPMESEYGLSSGDDINIVAPSEEYEMEADSFMKIGEKVYKDFIPLWFKRLGAEKPLVFRAIVSGITETTSPSWSGNKFIGNPYSFYMYEGVERSLAFNIKLFAASPLELNTIWEKLKMLTSYTYPVISGGVTTPPIIDFRMGDIYSNRKAFVDSLTYTIPDESNWETDGNVGYLPKIVDVALSMKFIETPGSEERLYDMEISKEAVKAINDKRQADKDAIDEETRTNGGQPSEEEVKKESAKKKATVSIKREVGNLKSKANSMKPQIPSEIAGGVPNPAGGQGTINEKLDGKTPTEAINAEPQYTPKQAKNIASFKSMGYKEVSKSSVPSDQKQFISEEYGAPSVFMRRDQFGKFDIYQITPNFSIPIRVAGGYS
jgi:hypothetical protein